MTNDNQKDPLSYWQSRALDAERERDELAAHVDRLIELEETNQALSAHVERLRQALEYCKKALDNYPLDDEEKNIVDGTLSEAPAQSLREVRAEAVESVLNHCTVWATNLGNQQIDLDDLEYCVEQLRGEHK